MKTFIKIDEEEFTLGEVVMTVGGMVVAIVVGWGFLTLLFVI